MQRKQLSRPDGHGWRVVGLIAFTDVELDNN